MSLHKEISFENEICQHLAAHGWLYAAGDAQNYDRARALFPADVLAWVQATQPKAWEVLVKNHGAKAGDTLLTRLRDQLDQRGTLDVLRNGIELLGLKTPLKLAEFKPALAINADIVARYSANRLRVVRQVHYSLHNENNIDLVLFLNGLPVATVELKTDFTQSVQDAIDQYRFDRHPRPKGQAAEPLLSFPCGALVHFAVSNSEVAMVTRLDGASTVFLPFNLGNKGAAGNPVNPLGGHRTAYLWEQVWAVDSWLEILGRYLIAQRDKKKQIARIVFPRYHQLDVTRKLQGAVLKDGPGGKYLIQHSAGSGKSNSITWAAYQLIEAYPNCVGLPGAKGLDQPLFDSVIVVTDRRLLDKQLRDNIKDFSEVKNIVAPALRSADLKSALENGKKIIITTIQKFPFIIDGISDLSDKRFAVIIDEAHSGQSGQAHDTMNRAMGAGDTDLDEDDPQDQILAAMQSRKMCSNASYLAFTATPKATTLEKFGEQQSDGSFKPFHLYSMKQAIEEGFILNVLANYTTYKSYYEIQKSVEGNPLFDTQKAQKKLRAYVERSQHTINTKAEIMLDHFIPQVVNAKKLRGKAKGMIITQNIESAIRYYKAVNKLLDAQGTPFKALIAFSGEKTVDGLKHTEAEMNGFPESETREKFDTDDYRLLIVANKYLTGFDQPKLAAMYVDKKLQFVLAVQALSRLNRSAPKLGKRTEDLFILDFFNNVDDIKTAFDPFYTVTTLSEATDVNVLHELKDALDQVGVYEWQEVEDFVTRYFAGADAQALSPIIDVAANRFNAELELLDPEKIDFKIKAKQFVKIYGQMASIIPFEVLVWEKLFWLLKFLIPKLMIEDPNQDMLDELLEAVDLSSYGLERTKLNHEITLDVSDTELTPQNPNPRGNRDGDPETDLLDEIIRSFNERWFQGWSATPEEQRVKFVNIVNSIRAHPDYTAKYEDNADPYNRGLALEKMLQDVMLKRRKDELELYKLFASDPAFKAAWSQNIEQVLNKNLDSRPGA